MNLLQRKIIHIDMDCFYAAIEIRDNPELIDKPVAVGGASDGRGVLCTCNYIAREYGVRSAMPTSQALRLCPDLIVLPVNMQKYKKAAKIIQAIFYEFTPLVEPLSLDEAFLDVSDCTEYQGSATLMAKAIRQKIQDAIQITASAGVAPNKFLAKIASGWKKPNGLFVIPPSAISDFVRTLAVKELFGVGKVTHAKLQQLNIHTCADLQKVTLPDLVHHFGKFGQQLYHQSRGIDQRPVTPNRVRKSLSVEETFTHDLHTLEECNHVIEELYARLLKRIQEGCPDLKVKNQYIKIKYSDFKQQTAERSSATPNFSQYQDLLQHTLQPRNSIRLLGLGVHFQPDVQDLTFQHCLF